MTALHEYHFQPGDLAACYGTDWVSRAISYGTASLFAPRRLRIGPAHVAMFCRHRGSPIWIESTTLCRHACVVRGESVSGVQAHFPEDRIRDYVADGGRVDLYRLSAIDRLSESESQLVSRILIRHFIGRMISYDTGGALLSGTRLFKRTRLLPKADLNELFCSELVAAVLMRLGRMNRANPTRFNPASLLRQLVRHGTYQFHTSYSQEKSS
ncbi:MAG: hypothetical protein ACE5KM_14680 [Planctomycetaceae bacterium]